MNPTPGTEWKDKLSLWINDPWSFCCDTVFTKDPADELKPIKRFPQHFNYLKTYTKIFLQEKRVAVPKSRRMFMSWYNVALHLWDPLFHVGRTMGVVSKKEDDSNELLSRMLFILDNLKEEDFPGEIRPKYRHKYNFIEFPQLNSVIMGFAQGSDQLRQHAFSRLLFDEMAFWERAKEMYSAAIPTLDGGGSIVAVSSAAPGFFKELVFDNITDAEAEPAKHYFPDQGIEVWRNPKNKFVIFQLHYSANEAKRDPKYREGIKADMPYSSYMQEYEISWETHQGKPVYPDWNRKVHGQHEEEFAELGIPLILGIDQGLMPACVVMQPKDDDIVVLREYTAENMGAERFKEYVKFRLGVDYPEWNDWENDFIVGLDPTGFNRRDVDERTYASVWAKDFNVKPGENSFEKRKKFVEDCLIRFKKGKPTFRVNLSNCPVLVRGFDGEYHYPDKMFEVEPNKARPLKNMASQPHDGLQYGLSVLYKHRKKFKINVPKPGYSFAGGEHGQHHSRNVFGRNRS